MGHVRQISVLFTDLVGSTELSSSVSPAHADELRREHFGVLRRAIAEADGTEVKNLGDGLMVVFPTASAALACAVGMQQATELDNRDRDRPFGLRVGVSAGEAVEEDGDFFGDPVIEAARVCARCEAGQILAADVVRLMAGRRNPHRCVSVGELDLKGLPEPVETVEVMWEPVGVAESAQRVPLPTRLLKRPAVGLVGRVAELETLASAVKRTAAGDGRQVVVVSGEAGMGKTTIVSEAARLAFDAGACVLFGHAEEDLSTPYGLFAEAFGHLVTHAADDELRSFVAACGPNLARIVPALSRRLPELDTTWEGDADTDRHLLFAAAVVLLRRITAERPAVLVLDDLQWADTGSLQLLRHIASEDTSMRLLLLGTYRADEVGSGHPLVDTLAALWRMDAVARLDLKGLDDRGVIDLLEATARHQLDDPGIELAHALYRETDGNPFFVTEVLRHLVETNAIYQGASGRWVSSLTLDDIRLPDSIREVIGARVGRLDPRAGRILSTAAVIGRDFDLELLARATETGEDDILDVLEAAEAAALVTEPATAAGRFAFTHALIQRTLYQDLSPSRRARTHERVAEALEDITDGRPGIRVGELAHHWAIAARPADTAKAVSYAMQAGEASLGALAPAEAVRWFTQALELLDVDASPRLRTEILVGLGDAQRLVGDPAHRSTLLEAARLADEIDDVDLLVRAVLTNNRGYFSSVGEADEERIAATDRALARVGEEPSDARARLLATSCAERTYFSGLDTRFALAEEAIEIARRIGDKQTFAYAVQRSFQAVIHPSTVERCESWASEAREVAPLVNDLATRFWMTMNIMLLEYERGERAIVDEMLSRGAEIVARMPHGGVRWNYEFQRAWMLGLEGDLAAYERGAQAALEVGFQGSEPDAVTFYGGQIINIRAYQGRLDEMIDLIEEGTAEKPKLVAWRGVLALAHARGGNLDRARELIAEHHATGFAMPDDFAWCMGMGWWMQVARLLGDQGAAATVRELIRPYPDRMITFGSGFQACVAHHLGLADHLTGRNDDADRWFAEAVALHERMRSPILTAETQAAWATMLADRGREDDHDRARAMAQGAADAAASGGWGYIESEAREVLQRLG